MDPLTVFAVALVLGVFHYFSARWWPFTKCGRCGGTGRNAGSNSKRWGTCGRCHGSGRRKRLGAYLFFRQR
jgi:DnaJ-class molecular chaperone